MSTYQGKRNNSNNQLTNFAVHNVDSDEQRGLPVLGKIVYDSRDNLLYQCDDITPDPTLPGGGTWTPIGGGGGGGVGPTDVVPVLTQGGALTLNSTPTFRRMTYSYMPFGSGVLFECDFQISVDGSTGTSGDIILLSVPDVGQAGQNGDNVIGYGWARRSGTVTPVFINAYDFVTAGAFQVNFQAMTAGYGAKYGDGIAFTTGDSIIGKLSTFP